MPNLFNISKGSKTKWPRFFGLPSIFNYLFMFLFLKVIIFYGCDFYLVHRPICLWVYFAIFIMACMYALYRTVLLIVPAIVIEMFALATANISTNNSVLYDVKKK